MNICLITALMVWSAHVEATEYIALHLCQEVQFSDAIVRVIITDAERATVRVNETLKGTTPRLDLDYMNHNFARVHQTLRVTPAMEAGIADHVWSVEKIVGHL
jgi:hypothetical protein